MATRSDPHRIPATRGRRLIVSMLLVLGCGALAACSSTSPGVAVGADGSDAATTTLPPTGAACEPARGAGRTSGRVTFADAGGERSLVLSVPDGYDGTAPAPLIVDLHGHGSSSELHESDSRLGARGAASGAVVLTPDALGSPSQWNFDSRSDGPDDFAFIDAVVASYVHDLCIDPDRIFVVGSSNGAAFAGLLVCDGHRWFSAVAMVIATVVPGCLDAHPIPALTIRGTADATVPYGQSPDSAYEQVATLAARDGCPSPPRIDHPIEGVDRATYGPCADDGSVVIDTVIGGIHTWPGGTRADKPGNSAASVGFDATGQILDFFSRGGRDG